MSARRWAMTAGVVALVVGGLCALLLVRGNVDGADDASPTTVSTVIDPSALPPVNSDVAAATLAYLDGDGAPLLALVSVAESSSGPLDGSECAEAKTELTAAGSPASLAALSEGVPDEVVRSSAEELRSSLVAVLYGCQSGGDYGDATAQATRAAALFRQRLAQLREA